jgi:uncharacterized protein YjiS (DUF1127 family)
MINEGLHGEYRLSSLNRHGYPLPGTVWASSVPIFVHAARKLLTAIRLSRQRARSRQELRELSDRTLRDIGLRREDVGYRFPTRVWHRD